MIALVCMMQLKKFQQTTPAQPPATTSNSTYTQELLNEPPSPLPAVVPAVNTEAENEEQDSKQKALSIAQNHLLSGNRGTIASYLNHIYQDQLTQGYSGGWGVEPWYKNTYIVKYRLTKARKEPIIYVFQVDVDANKLTGALNNISLDLVGKI